MQAKNFHADSFSSLERQLQEYAAVDFDPTLAFVFASVAHDIDAISSLFKKYDIELVGCTTSGEFVNGEVSDESMAVLLLDMKKESFFIYLAEEEDTVLAAKTATEAAKEKFENLALIVFSGGLDTNGDDIIKGVNEVGNYPLFGGMAGDDLKMQASYVFSNNKKSDKALLFLAIDKDKVDIAGLATSGWKAVGTPKIATRAEGNILYTIDGEPALDVFLKYFDIPTPSDRRKDVVAEVGMKYPLQLQRDGYTTLRAPLMANDEGALILAGEVPEGSSMLFSMPPDFDVIDQSVEDLGILKDNYPEADAVILVSCAARQAALGPMIEGELEGLQQLWNAPLIGFFSYGEIGTINGASVCDLHNETVSLILLKEK
ncbi:FIST signal transduction protein [Bernardetia sp.]|uniref:FIST signal transduction protein n=1 Tax=Bernardetia sp. TaxID=1937974 RepID=UPI0025C4907E|nr:FIST N-terminal domain-containing protein [Bernardetia sp.]